MARGIPFLGAFLLAIPAASVNLINGANPAEKASLPNYAATAPWDKRVPGQWSNWQEWSELIRLRRSGQRDFVYCAVPKNGCTIWKQMILRAGGWKHWDTQDKVRIHSPFDSGLDLVGLPGSRHFKASTQRPSEFYTMMGPESKAYKAVIVRDPAVRFLSSFLDRCVDMNEWNRCLSWGPVNFSTVVEHYEAKTKPDEHVDIHFRNQTALCGLQFEDFVKWDYIGHYENFSETSRRILQDNNMYHSYAATGWGPHGNASFGVEEQPMSNHLGSHSTEDHMCEYYTPELIHRVRVLYQPDYDRFGYDAFKWHEKCEPVWGSRFPTQTPTQSVAER